MKMFKHLKGTLMLLFNLYEKELKHLGVKSEEQFSSLPEREQDRLIHLCTESIEDEQQ